TLLPYSTGRKGLGESTPVQRGCFPHFKIICSFLVLFMRMIVFFDRLTPAKLTYQKLLFGIAGYVLKIRDLATPILAAPVAFFFSLCYNSIVMEMTLPKLRRDPLAINRRRNPPAENLCDYFASGRR
ncbi:MAG: hypothetical protein IKQ39_08435, partial [Oscillospiraceae bacterium]|nr:hypothetical protein [Oscillospiraceae bacterium]